MNVDGQKSGKSTDVRATHHSYVAGKPPISGFLLSNKKQPVPSQIQDEKVYGDPSEYHQYDMSGPDHQKRIQEGSQQNDKIRNVWAQTSVSNGSPASIA